MAKLSANELTDEDRKRLKRLQRKSQRSETPPKKKVKKPKVHKPVADERGEAILPSSAIKIMKIEGSGDAAD